MIELPLIKMVVAFLAISVRITGLLLFAPFFGSMSISPQIKAALVIAFSMLLYPIASRRLMAVDLGHWPTVVCGELLIGAAMGIATNLVFDAVQMAGQVLSIQMGFSLVTLLDPQTQADSTVVAMFHQTIAMLIFLRMDVHLWLLAAIGRSFEVLPPGAMNLSAAFTTLAVRAGGQVFVLGLQMAAPVFSATLLTDVALGLLGRASPNMPLMLLGPPVKTLLSLAVLFAALKYWPSMLANCFESSMNLSNHLLLLAR
ncbi:MAG TPA: flagellar biosynthetic protein FliR [Bryocella sp.]|nr:flagellar biosynthetic protein FliR [Bryocella sp.]